MEGGEGVGLGELVEFFEGLIDEEEGVDGGFGWLVLGPVFEGLWGGGAPLEEAGGEEVVVGFWFGCPCVEVLPMGLWGIFLSLGEHVGGDIGGGEGVGVVLEELLGKEAGAGAEFENICMGEGDMVEVGGGPMDEVFLDEGVLVIGVCEVVELHMVKVVDNLNNR